MGAADAPGTALVTVSGAVRWPGVCEIPLGSALDEQLAAAGAEAWGPALLGGYGGSWLGPGARGTALAPTPLGMHGASPGSGVVVALGATACGLAETARIAAAWPRRAPGSAGPARSDCPPSPTTWHSWRSAAPSGADVERLGGGCALVEGRGACRHPDGVVRLVRSAPPCSPTTSDTTWRRTLPGRRRTQRDDPAQAPGGPAVAVTRRLRVDPVACDAFGHCAELVPELIWLDEWGYPVLDAAPRAARRAAGGARRVRACPRRALRLAAVEQERGHTATGGPVPVSPRR